MGELMALLVTSVLVNNVILTQFLGMCPFMGVSKKKPPIVNNAFPTLFPPPFPKISPHFYL